MQYKRFFQLLVFSMILIPTLVAGKEYKFQVKELMLEVKNTDRTITFPIYLGTSFQKINYVSISLAGFAQSGEGQSIDGRNLSIEMPVSFKIKLADRFEPATGNLLTPFAKFEKLSGSFQNEVDFEVLFKPGWPDWSFLLDGHFEINLSWNGSCPEGCRYIKKAVMNIENALLIVNGISVDPTFDTSHTPNKDRPDSEIPNLSFIH
ncbi:MAG: hypothetical protein OEV42_10095 [Deltaproteobacteria bacterium]|nr:hypothetical protein [Deltaproteobacteria bacterium]